MSTYRQYYEILGLEEPPKDRKAVKRAYSKMLKVTRPEDNPEGFMELRDAHDIALKLIAREAENAAWEAKQILTSQTEAEPEAVSLNEDEDDSEPIAPSEPSLTYEDMLPDDPSPETVEPVEDTSYAIGPTPALDAPVVQFEPHETREPKGPPLVDELGELLSDSKKYNDREYWNQLFRKARRLDIDDYVDFENLLLTQILIFHGFYDDLGELYNTPEKLPQKFSPSITASLFKTMTWDQVHTQGYQRNNHIEWLSRRMHANKRGATPVPIPQQNVSGDGNVSVWMWIFGAFIILQIIRLVANL